MRVDWWAMIDAAIRTAYRVAHRGLRAYWFFRRPQTRGALAAVWRDEKLLLVKNSYRVQYTLPGGYVKPGEDPRDAASRELFEETQMDVAAARFEHAYNGAHPFENRDDLLDIFEAQTTSQDEPRVDRREVVWAGFKTPEEILRLDIVPHLRDYLRER